MTLTSLAILVMGGGGPVLTVDGEGYLRLVRDGRAIYARTVHLGCAGGKLGSDQGPTFLPSIPFSGDVAQIKISLQGEVSYQGLPIGHLVIATFTGAAPQKENDFYIAADRPSLGQPGDGLLGVLRLNGGSVPLADKPTPKAPSTATNKPTTNAEPRDMLSDVVVPSPPEGGCGIGFAPSVEVEGQKIRLGDICKINGSPNLKSALAAIVLGEVPAIGVEVRFDLTRIRVKLRAAAIDLEKVKINIPDVVRVYRRAQRATDADFLQAATEALTQRFGQIGKLYIKQSQPDMMLPIGNRRLVVDQIEVLRTGYRLGISVYVDDQRVNRRLMALETDTITPAVNVGQVVKVILRSGGATIETTGRVSRVGKPGEPVEVTVEGGTRLTGKVNANGTLEVNA